MSNLNIAIVDDHQLFADAIKNILPLYGNQGEINTFSNGDKLMTFLESNTIDVALLDLGIKEGMNGFETLKQLKQHKPHVKVIIISMHTQQEYIDRVRVLGGNAYLPKDCGAEQLMKAINWSVDDKPFYTTINGVSSNPFNDLSKTEYKVALELLNGKSNQEIAEIFFRSVDTINSHRKNIYKKLDVANVVEFVKLGIKFGLIQDTEL
jgi:two-component system invasion response regulator UvrY